MPKRVLLRGGHVLTMDGMLGDLYGGDVLIDDDRIAAVGHALDAGDAEVIDATDCIVIPGFVDSHRHTWETVIRGIAPDVSLGGYFDIVRDGALVSADLRTARDRAASSLEHLLQHTTIQPHWIQSAGPSGIRQPAHSH